MRCFFKRGGHIAAVEMLSGLTDEEAVKRSQEMFEARKDTEQFEGYEVWEMTRMVMRFPAVDGTAGNSSSGIASS